MGTYKKVGFGRLRYILKAIPSTLLAPGRLKEFLILLGQLLRLFATSWGTHPPDTVNLTISIGIRSDSAPYLKSNINGNAISPFLSKSINLVVEALVF